MKGFISKIIIFLALALFAIVIIVIVPDYIVKSKARFKIDSDITTLVLGHSHSAYSINDSILDKSINLSGSGESYFYNYQKLKEVIGSNEQIQIVFIEFANNNVDSIMDDWTWGFEKMSHRFHLHAPFMDSEDLTLLLNHNPTDLLTSYSIATRKHLYRMFNDNYGLIDEIGGYKNEKLSKTDELIAKNDFNSSISKSHSISETNLIYLRKMIEFCRDNKIKPFLIRSPQHPLYADLSNEAVYQNVLKTQFNDIELLDFDAMRFPNSYYLDLHHLNYLGANQFSAFFNTLIENDLLKASNLQPSIDNAIIEFNKKQITPNF